jgi:hypothetical protein
MLRSPMFYHTKGQKSLFKDDVVDFVLFGEMVKRGEMDMLIRFDVLEWNWNANYVIDNGEQIEFQGFQLSIEESAEVFAKGDSQLKAAVEKIAQKAQRKFLPPGVLASMSEATNVPASRVPVVAAAPIFFGSSTESAPAAASSTAPPAPAASALSTSTASSVPKRARLQLEKKAEALEVAKAFKCCSDFARHSPATTTCPFFKWTLEFPVTPRVFGLKSRSLSGKYHWATLNLASVFTDESGAYFKPEECGFDGKALT